MQCMPEPLSWKIGLGMKVAVLPCRRATFLMMYLYFIRLSAIFTSVSNRMSISHCPAVATSWWCTSTWIADLLQRQHHLGAEVLERVHRRHREVPFLVPDLVAEVRLAFLRCPEFQTPSTLSM